MTTVEGKADAMVPPSWASIARRAGRLLSLAALVAFIVALAGHWRASGLSAPPSALLAWVAVAGVAYAALLALLTGLWVVALEGAADGWVGRRLAARTFLTTQIAKYLPGNVFHLVGRHVALRAVGVRHGALLTATIWETALLVAGAVMAIALLALLLPHPPAIAALPGAAALAIVVLVALPAALALCAGRHVGALAFPRRAVAFPGLSIAFVFFIGQAAVFVGLDWALGGAWRPELACVAVIAWLVGFVTPGAPGGLGVREIAIFALMGGISGSDASAEILALAALFRVVTALGDLGAFLLGLAIAPEDHSPAEGQGEPRQR